MKQAGMRQGQTQDPSGRQAKGLAVEPPLGEKTAQLEALIECSPQAARQAKLAAMADSSPVVMRQRKVCEMIQNQSSVSAPGELSIDPAEPAQLMVRAGETVQRTQDDVAKYIFKNRQTLQDDDYVGTLFEGCYNHKGQLMTKWVDEEAKKEGEGGLVKLEQYLCAKTDKTWTEKLVKNAEVPGKIRKKIFEAWNKDQKKEDVLSRDLLADLERDVSTLGLDRNDGLKRSDSFTFDGNESVPDYLEMIDTLTASITVETGSGEKSVPVTDSIKTAGLLIRAYGDGLNYEYREARTHFALNLGGAYGIYHDSTGNGDLFYYPLAEKKDEEGVYFQEGGSSEHTWDKLAGALEKSPNKTEANTRLANVLLNNFDGTLDKQEVIAVGAMLADTKVSIQGWLFALEELRDHDFSSGYVSELFDVIGDPVWKYSLNANDKKNREVPVDEKGRQAGLGYKERLEDEDSGLDDEEELLEEEGLLEEEESQESKAAVKKIKTSHNGLL